MTTRRGLRRRPYDKMTDGASKPRIRRALACPIAASPRVARPARRICGQIVRRLRSRTPTAALHRGAYPFGSVLTTRSIRGQGETDLMKKPKLSASPIVKPGLATILAPAKRTLLAHPKRRILSDAP